MTDATTDAGEIDQNAWMEEDVLSTPELAVPPAQPDAHQGRILGVELVEFDSGSSGIKINLQSLDVPSLETNMMVFLPAMFVEDITVDPETLPDEKGNNQKFSYQRGISNKKKDATLQVLRRIAHDDYDRTPASVGITTKPTTVEEFVATLNTLLTDVELVFARRPEKNDDPAYDGQLRVKNFFSKTVVGNPKYLKRYRKAWETAEQQ